MQLFAIIFLIGVSVGALPTWKITADYYQALKSKELDYALDLKEKHLKASFEAEKTILKQAYDDELKHNVIVKEVTKYVPKIQKIKSVCNYTHGTVRLLNAASSRELPTAAAVPDAGHSTAADIEQSDITESDGIGYSLELLKAYNKARLQCNGLTQFIRENQPAHD